MAQGIAAALEKVLCCFLVSSVDMLNLMALVTQIVNCGCELFLPLLGPPT